MSSKSSKLSNNYWIRYLVIVLLWMGIIAATFQGVNRLVGQIDSSTNLIREDTAAGDGLKLYRERFNISGDDITHIILIHITDQEKYGDITSPIWRNYTYYLSYLLLEKLEPNSYSSILSEPIVHRTLAQLPNVDDIADSFISEDLSTGLIYLSSTELTFEDNEDQIKQDVHIIRGLLANYQMLLSYVEKIEEDKNLPSGYLVEMLPIKGTFDANEVILTGTPANVIDTIEVSEGSFRNSEIIAAVVIMVILIIVFRTPLGVIVPIIATSAALLPAYLITSFLAELEFFSVNDFLPSVIAMIGIAVAVDYNLFNLVRYREEFRKLQAKHQKQGSWNDETKKEVQVQASKVMNQTAGTAVMYSGFTVIIGFSALLIAGDDFSFGMAIGVSIVVFFSIIAARTLTPAILGLTGRFLDWPNFMSRAHKDIEEQNDEQNHEGFWIKWSNLVMRYPLVSLLIGLLLLAPFISFSSQVDLSFSLVKSLPEDTESREGFAILQDNFNLGEINPYQIIIDSGVANNSVFDFELITAVNNMSRDILEFHDIREKDETILKFESVNTLSFLENITNGEFISLNLTQILSIFEQPNGYMVGFNPDFSPIIEPNYYKFLFIENAKNFINWERGNNTLVIEVTSNLDPGSGAAWELLDVLEEKVKQFLGPLQDKGVIKKTYVTGLTALFKDSSEELYAKVPQMLLIAVILIILSLIVMFRSVLLPLKAVITIAGSILFGLGALVFVFQWGNFQEVTIMDFTIWQSDQVGITYFIPVFLFTTILGLGMDYSIFIISRIREEYEKGAEMKESVGLGLSKTAGVVTSAAIIMTVTFMVFALSPMLILKMMGLAMSIAIVVDATIVRIILLPSAMRLAGKYNFWLPQWLDKILPKLKLEH